MHNRELIHYIDLHGVLSRQMGAYGPGFEIRYSEYLLKMTLRLQKRGARLTSNLLVAMNLSVGFTGM